MTPTSDLLRAVLAGADHKGRRFRWPHVLDLMERIAEEPGTDAEDLLREITEFEGRLVFDGRYGHPHSMPPADLLRILAAQILAQWNPTRFRPTLIKGAKVAHSHAAKEILEQLAVP